MLKAVKECLKNWLVSNERLYWYIVVGLAVFGFGLVTMLGFAKLEKANAGEVVELTVPWYGVDTTVSIDLSQYPYYMYTTNSGSNGGSLVYMSNKPIKVEVKGDTSGNAYFYGKCGGWTNASAFPITNCLSFTNSFRPSATWYSNHDIYTNDTGELYLAKNIKETVYSLDAPYVQFNDVNVVNRLNEKDYLASVFSDFYEVYTCDSKWEYFGTLANYDSALNATYKVEVDFSVELPSDAYIEKQYTDKGVDIEWEHNVVKCSPDFIFAWNNDDKAPMREYAFKYVFDIVPDSNGCFSYSLGFNEIETLILYFDEDARAKWQEYGTYWRSIVLSYLHVDSVSMVVKTVAEDAILYGKGAVNIFERGIYDSCVEIAPDVDYSTMTDEEIDAMIEEAVKNAYDEYYKGLEDKLNDLQGQIDDIYSVGDGFGGNLENTDLWTGFQNLSEGLSSLGPSIRALSVLTGSVFAFLPIQITGIISFTLFAVCIIAIIKAIRG